MKKLPLLLIGYALLSQPFLGQEKKPMPPPIDLCTVGVAPDECKEITGYLAAMQQVTPPARSIQFVVADDASYKTEKDRAVAVTNNSPFLERPFLFSAMDSFYQTNAQTGMLLEKVYFDETSACHIPVIDAGKVSDTKFGRYDFSQCASNLEYTLSFIEGSFLGVNNATNWMQCAIDKSQQDGKACRKR